MYRQGTNRTCMVPARYQWNIYGTCKVPMEHAWYLQGTNETYMVPARYQWNMYGTCRVPMEHIRYLQGTNGTCKVPIVHARYQWYMQGTNDTTSKWSFRGSKVANSPEILTSCTKVASRLSIPQIPLNIPS